MLPSSAVIQPPRVVGQKLTVAPVELVIVAELLLVDLEAKAGPFGHRAEVSESELEEVARDGLHLPRVAAQHERCGRLDRCLDRPGVRPAAALAPADQSIVGG